MQVKCTCMYVCVYTYINMAHGTSMHVMGVLMHVYIYSNFLQMIAWQQFILRSNILWSSVSFMLAHAEFFFPLAHDIADNNYNSIFRLPIYI